VTIEKPTSEEALQAIAQAGLNDSLFETFPKQIFKYSEGGHLTISVPNNESTRKENFINKAIEEGILSTEEISEFVPTPSDLFTGYTNHSINIIPTEKGKALMTEANNSKLWNVFIGTLTVNSVHNIITKKEGDKYLFYVNYTTTLTKNLFYDYFYPNGQVSKYNFAVIGKENDKWVVVDHGFDVRSYILGDKENQYDTTGDYRVPTFKEAEKLLSIADYSFNSNMKGYKFYKYLNAVVRDSKQFYQPYLNFLVINPDATKEEQIKFAFTTTLYKKPGIISFSPKNTPITEVSDLAY